jgi:thiol:disulfide interchange protein DsbD
MKRLVLLCLALVLAAAGCGDDGGAASGPFQKLTPEQALARARSEKKVVLLEFYADWCAPCRQLERTTFRDGQVRRFLNERTVAVRVNIDDNEKLVAQYRVAGIPCMVFVDADGREVGRILGPEPPGRFLRKAVEFVR